MQPTTPSDSRHAANANRQGSCFGTRCFSSSRLASDKAPGSKSSLEDYFVYPIRVQDRLPEIKIPLLPGDGDVVVDLQAIFQRSYDAGPYRRRIRYGHTAPVPPLDDEARPWAARLLEGLE